MALEIERKYSVNHSLWEKMDKGEGLYCVQTYLVNEPKKTIRVRILGKKAFLTIKGATTGVTRKEFEYEIPWNEGETLIKSFGEKSIIKTRYIIVHHHYEWEVDVFHGDNEGLIVAEIELKSEDEQFPLPEWVDKEISDDPKYYNACLLKHPFCNW